MILSPVCDNMMINCGKSAKIAVLEPGTAVFCTFVFASYPGCFCLVFTEETVTLLIFKLLLHISM